MVEKTQQLTAKPAASPYRNYSSSSSVSNDVTNMNDYCLCLIDSDTSTGLWWDQLFSMIAGTMIYTVDTGTNKTIGSSMSYNNAAVYIPDTSIMTGHGQEVFELSTLSDGESPA